MRLAFEALPTAAVRTIRRTGRDACGNAVARHVSDEDARPCRHCPGEVPRGTAHLILAFRPFRARHAHAETGRIFLCARV